MKKVIGLFMALVGVLMPTMVQAASTLPESINGKITLTEDVILSEKYVIANGSTITIDLNGFTLTGPANNYAIDNQGNLTIVDNGTTKGKIECIAPSSSCIRNGADDGSIASTILIDGVTINASFVALKTEPTAISTVNNSTLISTYTKTDTGTIMNWGTVQVNNSNIEATASSVAIYATSGYNSAKNSETTINSSILTGKYAVYSRKYASTDTTSQIIDITNGTMNGTLTGTSTNGAKISVQGEVKTNGSYLSSTLAFAKEGTNVILTSDIAKGAKVPEGVTLTINEGVTYTVSGTNALVVNGTLVNNGTIDAGTYVEETNTYYASLQRAVKLIGEGTTVIVLKNLNETTTVQPYANKNITIDLNGYSVTGDIVNPENGTMIITDSSDSGTGKLDGTITNNGNLTIESGNYTNAPVTVEGANTTITGGSYPIKDIENATIPEDKVLVKNEDGSYTLESYANLEALLAILEKIEAITVDNYSEYTEESLQIYLDALLKATEKTDLIDAELEALGIEEPTERHQEQIDEITKLLIDGYASLVKKEQQVVKPTIPSDNVSENPKTNDMILTYITVGIISILGVGLTIKHKKFNA